jgi:anti-anti-sigma factor
MPLRAHYEPSSIKLKGSSVGLRIGVERAIHGMVILSPVGSVDSETCELLEKEVKKVMRRSMRTLVLDMTGVDFVTSRGVGVIAKTKVSLAEKGRSMAIIGLQPQVRKVFEIMSLLPVLNVFADREELDEYLGKVQRQITEDQAES